MLNLCNKVTNILKDYMFNVIFLIMKRQYLLYFIIFKLFSTPIFSQNIDINCNSRTDIHSQNNIDHCKKCNSTKTDSTHSPSNISFSEDNRLPNKILTSSGIIIPLSNTNKIDKIVYNKFSINIKRQLYIINCSFLI